MEERKESVRATSSRWKLWLAAIVATSAVMFSTGGFLLYENKHAPTPLPASLVESVDFPVFYPERLPSGYYYQQGSARIDQNIFFYAITNGDAVINIGQQRKPTDFNFELFVATIKDFKPTESSAGKAYSGTNGSTPVTMIVGKSTFISITGTSDINNASVGTIAKSLR